MVSQRARAEWALAAVTMVWGTSFTLVQGAIADAPVLSFLSVRFTMATGVLWAAHRLGGGTVAGIAAAVRPGLAAGLVLALAYLLQTHGLLHTTPSKSAFLTSLCVVLVPFLGSLVHKSVPRPFEALGVAMAMIGMGLMTLPGESLEWNPGDLLTLGCAVAFAIHILTVGRFARRTDPVAFILVQAAAAAAVFWFGRAISAPDPVRWTGRLLLALGVTSVLCTALAYSVQAWAQRQSSSTRTALIFSLEPVAAAATSYVVAGESLPPRGLLGAILILGGVLLVDAGPPRNEKPVE